MSEKVCSKCGKSGHLFHKHHKDHDHENNSSDNVVILCPYCHGKEHGIDGGGLQDYLVDTTIEISDRRLSKRLRDGFDLLSDSE